MKIIIPIKQVPETKSVKMDEKTGTVIREGVDSIINPLDLYAIELACQLKEKHGAELTAISMGPPKAVSALREAIAMGVDSAALVCGKEFAGSDTWATGLALAMAIKKLGGADLIICGERATDGDTGQVGPGIAAFLDLPVASYANKFVGIAGGKCVVKRLIEGGEETVEIQTPAVLTVVKEISDPRLPTFKGKMRAKKTEIPVWGAADLGIDLSKIGLKGSPTKVVKIFTPKVARECKKLSASDESQIKGAITELKNFLAAKELYV
jgi:electron transfer flavoprotein beta subunit